MSELTGSLSAVSALASHASARDVIALGHTSFTQPDTVTAWRLGAALTRLTALPGPTIAGATDTQVRYPSTNGTDVPMLLVHAPDTTIDAGTPTLLTGYGGFNIAETPAWSPFVAAWCEAGGQLPWPADGAGVRRARPGTTPGCATASPRCRRLRGGRRLARHRGSNELRAPRHPRRLQRRPAGRRVRGAPARPLRGRGVRRPPH